MHEPAPIELSDGPRFEGTTIVYEVRNVGTETIARHSITDHVHLYKNGELTRTDTVLSPASDLEPQQADRTEYEPYLDGWGDAAWSAGVQADAEHRHDVTWLPFYVQDGHIHVGDAPDGLGSDAHPDAVEEDHMGRFAGMLVTLAVEEPASFKDGKIGWLVRNNGQETIARGSLKDYVHLFKNDQPTRSDPIAVPDTDLEPGQAYRGEYDPYLDGWDDARWTAGVQVNAEGGGEETSWVYFAVQGGSLVARDPD